MSKASDWAAQLQMKERPRITFVCHSEMQPKPGELTLAVSPRGGLQFGRDEQWPTHISHDDAYRLGLFLLEHFGPTS